MWSIRDNDVYIYKNVNCILKCPSELIIKEQEVVTKESKMCIPYKLGGQKKREKEIK